jgi:hypothetical protein
MYTPLKCSLPPQKEEARGLVLFEYAVGFNDSLK